MFCCYSRGDPWQSAIKTNFKQPLVISHSLLPILVFLSYLVTSSLADAPKSILLSRS